ncbi:hypothetical protein LTR46_009683 [Exophiala xenobiotica]|nr:hypothetical protein LTR46_009683 [Exophiala xenobiotica]
MAFHDRSDQMEADTLPLKCEAYELVDPNIPIDIQRAFSLCSLQSVNCEPPQAQFYQPHNFQDVQHLLQTDNQNGQPIDALTVHPSHFPPPTTRIQLSDLELAPTWTNQEAYPHFVNNHNGPDTNLAGMPFYPYTPDFVSSPFSTYQYYDESDSRSAWSTTPEFSYCHPTVPVEDEETFDDKPYAMLIYEALKQAPGHRMMLRDIYDWFRHNTTKPQESGSNGWQNSIRHNLSMNKAFENDRDTTRANSRKANSVWVLTEDAVKNGVQSTTRYRKTGGGKRMGQRAPAIQRQRSGAKGGRAASRAARQRRQENPFVTSTPLTASPATPYSDISDYQSFDYNELRPTVRSWSMTTVDDQQPLPDDPMQHLSFSPQRSMDFSLQRTSYCDESLRLQSILMRPNLEQSVNELGLFQAD